VLLKSTFVIPRNNERCYGSAVRSTTHEISKENAAKQFHRDSLDFFYSELTFGMYQNRRWEIIFSIFIKVGTLFYIFIYFQYFFAWSTLRLRSGCFQKIKTHFFATRGTLKQNIFWFKAVYNSTFYFTIESRPASSLDSLGFIEIEF
jgi:hypothetical protein